mmetsp:Transcript_50873/g.95159  ORF Transcript_50873/g.95159 Transcript_50873/m.95159 type:complete len:196 (-) Transcript_50873:76-663(-)
MARAHELSTGMTAPEGYPVRPVDKWHLRTKADLELNGNTFGGHFLDTTTSHELPRHILERTQFTVACNRGEKPGGRGISQKLPDTVAPSPKAGAPQKRLRLPNELPSLDVEQQGQRRGVRPVNASSMGDLHHLPALAEAGGIYMPSQLTATGKKLKSVSADTRYAKRGWGRGGPLFWPETSYGMSQTMTNLHHFS